MIPYSNSGPSQLLRKLTFPVFLLLMAGCSSSNHLPRATPPTVSPATTPTQPAVSETVDPIGPAGIDSAATAQAMASEVQFSTRVPSDPTPITWLPWLRDHAHPLGSLSQGQAWDLQFLQPLLAERSIVQLGESDHRTAQFSSGKVRLIRYLHQELGYNVIAFESGLLDCYLTQEVLPNLTPHEAMEGCIFGVWHTEEVLPLFEYILESQSTNSPLILAGFDIQPSGARAAHSTEFFSTIVEKVNPSYAEEIRQLDPAYTEQLTDGMIGYGERLRIQFEEDPVVWYEELATFFDESSSELQAEHNLNATTIAIARRAAWSRARFIEMQGLDSQSPFALRDRSMAANIQFLRESIYPGGKIIVWAHNAHIANQSWFKSGRLRNMGSYLVEDSREDIYTIGLVGYQFSGSTNATPLAEPISFHTGTVESLMHEYGAPVLFVDIQKHRPVPGNEWLFKRADMVSDPDIILSETYDGLLFFDLVTRPTYLPSNE